MEKRTVALREAAVKAVPSNRGVTGCFTAVGWSFREGYVDCARAGRPMQCCCDVLATSLCTYKSTRESDWSLSGGCPVRWRAMQSSA